MQEVEGNVLADGLPEKAHAWNVEASIAQKVAVPFVTLTLTAKLSLLESPGRLSSA
jgi:hypothetical protein